MNFWVDWIPSSTPSPEEPTGLGSRPRGTPLAWYAGMPMCPATRPPASTPAPSCVSSRARSRAPGRRRPLDARWLLALACTGCADLLGLDGLSFDQAEGPLVEPKPSESPAAGAGGTTSVLGPGTGGSAEELEDRWGFPEEWAPNALVVAADLPPTLDPQPGPGPATSALQVYDPASGELTSQRFLAYDREERVSAWEPGLTHAVARPHRDVLGIFGYRKSTGAWSFAAPFDPWAADVSEVATPEPVVADSGDTTPAWTHITLLWHGGDWRVVYYDAESGDYNLLLADPERMAESEREKTVGSWRPGFTGLYAYATPDGGHGLLSHDATTGEVVFSHFTDDGWALETVATRQWNPRWSLLLPFVAEGQARILFYDPAGLANVDVLHEDLVAPDTGESWPGKVTSLTLFHTQDVPRALLYSRGQGVAKQRQLHPFEGEPVVVR